MTKFNLHFDERGRKSFFVWFLGTLIIVTVDGLLFNLSLAVLASTIISVPWILICIKKYDLGYFAYGEDASL
jgi:hypothetical protein